MAPTLPIVAAKLRFAYSEAEDRLTLLATNAGDQAVHVTLTRRLTDRLINGLALLLERSSALAVQAPAELRDDIILMEHQDALYGAGRTTAPDVAEAVALPDLPVPRLVSAIDITVTPTAFAIGLRDGPTALVALSLDRHQVHRVVESLGQHAEAAGWNVTVAAAWLEPGQTEIVLN